MAKEKNISYALRLGYMNLLNGNITVNGSDIPVFKEGANIGDLDMYILIQDLGSADDSIKVGRDSITSTQITIFTRGEELDGTEIEDIEAQILEIVEPYNGFTVPVSDYFYIRKQRVANVVNSPVFRSDTTVPTFERHMIIEHDITHKLR